MTGKQYNNKDWLYQKYVIEKEILKDFTEKFIYYEKVLT